MSKYYSKQDLRRRSFKGQNLEGADFSHADIRGADFSYANLARTNFSHAVAGLTNQQAFSLNVIAILVTLGAVMISTGAGCFASRPFIVGFLPTQSKFLQTMPAEFGTAITGLNQLFAFTAGIPMLSFIVLFAIFSVTLIRQGIRAVLKVSLTLLAILGGATTFVILFSLVTFLLNIFFNSDLTNMIDTIGSAILVVMAAIAQGTVVVSVVEFVVLIGTIGTGIGLNIIKIISGLSAVYRIKPFINTMIILVAIYGAKITTVEAVLNPKIDIITLPFTIALLGAITTANLSLYISQQAMIENPKFAFIAQFATLWAATGGTNFQGADLTNASFRYANLGGVDFRNTTLTGTDWFRVHRLRYACLETTYLQNQQIRQLVTERKGRD